MLITLFILLNIADVITTMIILKRGGRERNKIMLWVMDKVEAVPALIVIKFVTISFMCFALVVGQDFIMDAILAYLCGIYTVVVFENYEVIRRQVNEI